MADIFISYKSEDKEWAKKIDTLVSSAGYTTWWDTSLVAGNTYNDEIDKQLQLAKVTIVVWSERSWNSRWVKEEALFSRDQDKLLPIRIDEVKIGVPFYTLQTLDFTNSDGRPEESSSLKLFESLERY